MRINLENYHLWLVEAGGIDRIEVETDKLTAEQLLIFLERMGQQLRSIPVNQTHLVFTNILSNDQCAALIRYIENNPDVLPFTKLTINVNRDSLNSAAHIHLIKLLNNTSIKQLHLQIPERSGDEIVAKLPAPIHYPITFSESSPAYQIFANQVIPLIQKHTIARRFYNKNASLVVISARQEPMEIDQAVIEPQAKKIKLKELMQRADLRDNTFDPHIKLEVQHIEIEQQVETQEIQLQVELEEKQQEKLELYNDDLIDYQRFQGQPYSDFVKNKNAYELVKTELFANLPHAIKYLSPEAAMVIAKHLPELSTLNTDNLPQNFVLKATANGELVLDYDLYASEKKTNKYTPTEGQKFEASKPIYEISLPADILHKWVNGNKANSAKQLDNLWIKYGREGVELFFATLNKCDQTHQHFSTYLYDVYLKHFPHWDHFLDDHNFLISLDKIRAYNPTKLACLKKFLETTGSSQHDLKNTLAAFDDFWDEWYCLCQKYKIDMSRINTNWQTPKGGNPIVYMERLLTILKNARELNEQLDCLNGIILNNYGAYYASKYEDFKIVSQEMAFTYDPDKQNQVAFNQNLQLYRSDLQILFELTESHKRFLYYQFYAEKEPKPCLIDDENKEISQQQFEELIKANKVIPYHKDNFKQPYRLYYYSDQSNKWHKLVDRRPVKAQQFYEMAYRFLGQQEKSIPIKLFVEKFSNFVAKFIGSFNNRSDVALSALFFMAHDRYSTGIDFERFFDTIDELKDHDVSLYVNKELLKLYNKDARLNPSEGLALCHRFSAMNTSEYERIPFQLPKSHYIKKLFQYFENNKPAAFKLFQKYVYDTGYKWPFVYAIDTAEYLAQDVYIAKAYQDDLLLFTHLISSEYKEVYYERRNDEISQQIILRLNQVKDYLVQAATMAQPNNMDYAIKVLLGSNKSFTYKQFLQAFAEINHLKDFDHQKVKMILTNNGFKLDIQQLEVFARGHANLNEMKISLIMALKQIEKYGVVQCAFRNNIFEPEAVTEKDLHAINKKIADYKPSELAEQNQIKLSYQDLITERTRLQKKREEYLAWMADKSLLMQLNVTELQRELQDAWQRNGVLLTAVGKVFLIPYLGRMKSQVINSEFSVLEQPPFPSESPFTVQLKAKIHDLKDLSVTTDFAKLERIMTQSARLAELFKRIMQRDNFKSRTNDLTDLFKTVDFALFDYETLFALLNLLESMPQRDYFNILQAFFSRHAIINNNQFSIDLINIIQLLHNHYFPSAYIESVVKLAGKLPIASVQSFAQALIPVFQRNQDDTLLKWIVTDASLPIETLPRLANLTQGCKHYRDQIQKLLLKLHSDNPLQLDAFLKKMNGLSADQIAKILEMIARSEAVTSRKTRGNDQINYVDLVDKMKAVGDRGIESLYQFYKVTTIGIASLYNGLRTHDVNQPIDILLSTFEKTPYGQRNKQSEYNVTQVERVVNSFIDLNNNQSYSYRYRKQMMEAFLFINDAGHDLPLYRNKPAMELSNIEIRELFLSIKKRTQEFAHFDQFQRRLYALGLMREAMYRATNQFPYSTQIIALIDCMMHKGDVISNIDAGQGKGLIDTMKAALLWLESDRVDLSTSSLVDTKRDIEIYSPFFSLLGIPYASDPITPRTPIDLYNARGINLSTMSQLALFYSKAKGEGQQIGNANDIVSLVSNESDYTILDDKTIYRYASSSGAGVGIGNEWIYTAINEFVHLPAFTENKTSKEEDIAALKKYLMVKAKENKKSVKLINKFTDQQLLIWIQSAIIVNYRLHDKYDYVLPEENEQAVINGQRQSTRVAKILMKDGKVSHDTKYGNGMQQLLHAKSNSELGRESFVIEPESKTIISTNNRNMIDFYRSKRGFIWGSSATVGYDNEIEQQYHKYGFEFSKIEPHQAKIVKLHPHIILENEADQFTKLIKHIKNNHGKQNTPPALVFFKDIKTAERFYEQLAKQLNPQSIQLFTGLGNEEKIIKDAATAGKVTVTTATLGRNTDILYDKKIGMTVYNGFYDTKRKFYQRGGRTGRDGSPGDVYTILNQADFPGLTIEQLTVQVEAAAEKEREYNEGLYNIFGYLLSLVEDFPKEFYRKAWATFSDRIEGRYRQLKIDRNYQEDHFVAEVVQQFKQICDLTVLPEDVINYLHRSHPPIQKQAIYNKRVLLKDCIPSAVIAYGFINHEKIGAPFSKDAAKNQLIKIFAAVRENKTYEANKQYIAYLNAGATTAEIKAAHQEFLAEYLTEQTNISKNRSFITRWLGFEGHLNKIVRNENYLLMFKALTDVRGEKIAADEITHVIRMSVITLLDEYVQNSWFINSKKKEAAKNLIMAVNHAPDLASIFTVIQQAKLDVVQNDIKVNQNSFWRSIKPLHASGRSRLQTTLDKALALSASLTHHSVDTNLVKDLTGQLKSVVTNDNLPETFTTVDSLKVAAKSFQYRDKNNAEVVSESIEAALQNKAYVKGMVGRFALFPALTASKKQDLEKVDTDNQRPDLLLAGKMTIAS